MGPQLHFYKRKEHHSFFLPGLCKAILLLGLSRYTFLTAKANATRKTYAQNTVLSRFLYFCKVNSNVDNGSYKGVIKREAVYKGTNKDYLPEAKPTSVYWQE